MSQFTLYENNNKNTKKIYPYFLDVQSDLIGVLNSRMVVPLTPVKLLETAVPQKLCPIIEVGQNSYALLTHQMTSIPAKMLKLPVMSLKDFRQEIIGAIDFLVVGI